MKLSECKTCRGSGQVGYVEQFAAGGGKIHMLVDCPDCNGKGFVKEAVGRKRKEVKDEANS